MSVPKFYVQVSYYCFLYVILFFIHNLHTFDMQMLVISVLCICILMSFHIVPVFIVSFFWKVEICATNVNATAFITSRFIL